MFNLFYRNRQLLLLTLILVAVWGLSSFFTLPRMEDPELTQRFGSITTFLPGASPERVETLVTEKLEQELQELEEIKTLESTSSTGISVIGVELKDSIRAVDPVWSKVRSKLDDAVPELPADASDPEYRDGTASANALIVGLTWKLETPANYTILRRRSEGLADRLRAIPGTDKVEAFGDPDEEIRVAISAPDLARLGLTAQTLSQQIQASDAKLSAGQLRDRDRELLFEVDSELDSLERVRQIPIQLGADGETARLGDIARVEKGVETPAAELALVNGRAAVVLAAQVESAARVDLWANQARQTIQDFQTQLSDGIGIQVVLDQSQYVKQRLNGAIANLLLGVVLAIAASVAILGWKSALLVGSALPLATLMVFGSMKALGIPLHQMSVTGIVIALGLLIDNAIVVVDEVQGRLRSGASPADAVGGTVKHLLVPLLASTLTTVLAFVPIALSPGATGEFIGAIGATVILALLSSLFLSLTVISSLAGRLHSWTTKAFSREENTTVIPAQAGIQTNNLGFDQDNRFQKSPKLFQRRWLQEGFSHPQLTRTYRWTLRSLLRRPWLGIGLSLLLPLFGFLQFASLEQQFFPPTNRDQFQIEFELSSQAAIAQTEQQIRQARQQIRQHPAVEEVHWFLGKSAPSFFYNVVAQRENAPNYAQGLVQLNTTKNLRQTIQTLQADLDAAFPEAQVLVKQLEQGPPFDAPIELRLYGSDLDQLRILGDQLRRELAQMEQVTHTRADLTEALPKLALSVDEVQARRAGLDNAAIARQLDSTLEGSVGGSILEDTEDIPVRVRVAGAARGDLAQVSSLDLLSPSSGETVPLDALADVGFVPDLATISRYDGQRINTVQGFLTAGALPATVLQRFEQHLDEIGFTLPPGYRLAYGGEADARGTAVGNLFSTVGVLAVLMAATLILSFHSFGLAALIGSVAICAVGLAALALWVFNSLFGFTAILGTLGLIGLAINDSIVVLAALRENAAASQGNWRAAEAVVMKSTRHVVATTVTTIIGFTPLLLDETGFWPPLAIAIAGGLGGATLLALYFIPSAYLLLTRRQQRRSLEVAQQASSMLTSADSATG